MFKGCFKFPCDSTCSIKSRCCSSKDSHNDNSIHNKNNIKNKNSNNIQKDNVSATEIAKKI